MVFLIDFDDSFTFNIATTLFEIGVVCKVVHFKNTYQISEYIQANDDLVVIIYGPGPGHPIEYNSIFESIMKWRKYENIFHVGICLGHQILGLLDGFEVGKLKIPLHGDSINIRIPNWPNYFKNSYIGKSVNVQKYNSLYIKNTRANSDIKTYVINKEILIRQFKNGISYQFHPESIGTSCPKVFFECIKEFLYNPNHGSFNI